MLADVTRSNKTPWENVKPAKKGAFGRMGILGKDEWLDATDAMMPSHVLSDPDSKFFFTADGVMFENTVAADLESPAQRETARGTRNVGRVLEPVRREP